MQNKKIIKILIEFFKPSWGKFILSVSLFILSALFISAQCPGLYSRMAPTESENAGTSSWSVFPIKGLSCKTLFNIFE